jgi:Alcohol dehydrogenase transcription factor Myb/SANT-like.
MANSSDVSTSNAIVPFDDSFSSMIEKYTETQIDKVKSQNSTTFIWTAEYVVSLIRAYESYPELWNMQCAGYKSTNKKTRAWNEISNYFQLPVIDLKRKMANLLSSYRRERVKVDSKKKENLHYEPQLYFYRHFEFMNQIYQPKAFKLEVGGDIIKPDYYLDEDYAAKVKFSQFLLLVCERSVFF